MSFLATGWTKAMAAERAPLLEVTGLTTARDMSVAGPVVPEVLKYHQTMAEQLEDPLLWTHSASCLTTTLVREAHKNAKGSDACEVERSIVV
jgi:hypothetical protein